MSCGCPLPLVRSPIGSYRQTARYMRARCRMSLLSFGVGTNCNSEAGTFPFSASSPLTLLVLRQRWRIRFGPAIKIAFVIAMGERGVNLTLVAANRHDIGMRVVMLVTLATIGAVGFLIYRLSKGYRGRETLLLDAEGVALRRGRTDQRCEWREVTAMRRTLEETSSGAASWQLYIEQGAAPAIALDDTWTIPHIGPLQRLS